MSPCERIEHHLSALADGELRPLEAIALRRHLDDCAECHRAFQALEALKVQVHVAGGERLPSDAQKARWRHAVEARAASDRARRRRVRTWVPAAAAAALACVVALAWSSVDGPAHEPAPAEEVAGRLDHDAMARMIRVHRGAAGPSALDDLVQAGALVTFEHLPGSFITPEGERTRVVQASLVDCDESMMGSSIAVLRAAELDLPPEVDAALFTGGVFVEVIDGAEVRISRSGGEIFVLLSEVGPAGGAI